MSRGPDRGDGSEGGFVSRWSRRKRSAVDEAEEAGAIEPRSVDPELPAEPEPAPERTDAEILAELGLKDPDALEPGDDFSGFMAKAVPEHLRRRALRRLWRSNPVLAVLDGLNDYDTDFTGDTVAPGMLKTAYQVGRGIVREVAAPDEDEGQGSATEAEAPPSEGPEGDVVPEAEGIPPGDSLGNELAVSEVEDDPRPSRPQSVAGTTRRRIRFDFD